MEEHICLSYVKAWRLLSHQLKSKAGCQLYFYEPKRLCSTSQFTRYLHIVSALGRQCVWPEPQILSPMHPLHGFPLFYLGTFSESRAHGNHIQKGREANASGSVTFSQTGSNNILHSTCSFFFFKVFYIFIYLFRLCWVLLCSVPASLVATLRL